MISSTNHIHITLCTVDINLALRAALASCISFLLSEYVLPVAVVVALTEVRTSERSTSGDPPTVLLLSVLPTPYERSQESSEHQPRRRMFHASSPPQAKTSTDYKRDARADAFTT
eukprot:Em0031g17a